MHSHFLSALRNRFRPTQGEQRSSVSMKNPVSHWRTYTQIHRLEGCQCKACKKLYYPKHYLCECGSEKFVPFTFQGTGTLLTWTKINSAPKGFECATPYYLGIITLDEGVLITANITEIIEKLEIGMPMKAVFRKLYQKGETGIIRYGLKFKSCI